VASVIIFNYLFTIPRFSFAAYETGYPITFLVMFLTALITGTLAIEKEKNAKEKEAAAALARSEQLRANLLRTISHDLRTPLTSISGNASNLLANGDRFDDATKRQIYTDIYEDSMWLISLVENLLSATRIEEGRMTLRTETELLSDIVEEAVRHARCERHTLHVEQPEDLLLVRADARLIVQVIVNLIDNAVKYTPPGSSIAMVTRKKGDMAEIEVADNGPGLSDEEKQKVFDKFYSGANKIADNRRSLGLGLYLCKAIIEAHGGTICVQDNHPQGAVFRFTLPLQEMPLHEE
jgi:two-component system sensor histidine kinase KdpD